MSLKVCFCFEFWPNDSKLSKKDLLKISTFTWNYSSLANRKNSKLLVDQFLLFFINPYNVIISRSNTKWYWSRVVNWWNLVHANHRQSCCQKGYCKHILVIKGIIIWFELHLILIVVTFFRLKMLYQKLPTCATKRNNAEHFTNFCHWPLLLGQKRDNRIFSPKLKY